MVEASSLDFKHRLYRLPELGINHDCKFLVGADSTVIEGHKFLFAIASDVFQAMFFGELKEGENVRIEDLDPVGFESMKQFIYTGEVILKSVKHAFLTYLAADRYLINDLKQVCFKYIEAEICYDKILEFYEWCLENHLSDFDAICRKIVQDKTDKIVECTYFLNSKLETIEMILKLPSLCLASEFDLFTHFVRWAVAEAERQNIINVQANGGGKSRKQMSSYFNNLKKHVRFLTMSNGNLMSTVSRSPLLTDYEKQAISGCMLMQLDTQLLPESISPIKVQRKFTFKAEES